MRYYEYKGFAFIFGIILLAIVYLIKFLLSSLIGTFILIIIVLVIALFIFNKLFLRKFQNNSNKDAYNIHIDRIPTNYIDNRGYERDGYGDLVHRNIAYEEIYKDGYMSGEYEKRFSDYDVHHIDGNKRNNSVENLQILTREEHEQIHQLQRNNFKKNKL